MTRVRVTITSTGESTVAEVDAIADALVPLVQRAQDIYPESVGDILEGLEYALMTNGDWQYRAQQLGATVTFE